LKIGSSLPLAPAAGVKGLEGPAPGLFAPPSGLTALPAGLAALVGGLLAALMPEGLCAREPAGVPRAERFNARERLTLSLSLPEPLLSDASVLKDLGAPLVVADAEMCFLLLYEDSLPLAPDASKSAALFSEFNFAFLREDSLPLASERLGEPGRLAPILNCFLRSDGVFSPFVEVPDFSPFILFCSPSLPSFLSSSAS
jgi:hypothetical protein